MGQFVYSVRIEAAPALVWGIYVDPRRIPEWQTGRPLITDVRGVPGEQGSTYVSKRGVLRARTSVLSSAAPTRLVTLTEAYVGLQFEVTSQLSPRAGGTDLEVTAVTQWPRGRRLIGKGIERMVLSSGEARKELDNLKRVVESEVAG